MYKWMYDRLLEEYKKEPVEKLVNKIISLKEIEVRDRCFANECEAGTSIYAINELFNKVTEWKTDNSVEKVNEILSLLSDAENSWGYIKRELSKMNDNSRYYSYLEKFETSLEKAKNSTDTLW